MNPLKSVLDENVFYYQKSFFNGDGKKEDVLKEDLQQAAAVAKKVITEKKEQKRVSKILTSIPDGWKKKVIKGIEVGTKKLPLEENTWFALKKLLLTLQHRSII